MIEGDLFVVEDVKGALLPRRHPVFSVSMGRPNVLVEASALDWVGLATRAAGDSRIHDSKNWASCKCLGLSRKSGLLSSSHRTRNWRCAAASWMNRMARRDLEREISGCQHGICGGCELA